MTNKELNKILQRLLDGGMPDPQLRLWPDDPQTETPEHWEHPERNPRADYPGNYQWVTFKEAHAIITQAAIKYCGRLGVNIDSWHACRCTIFDSTSGDSWYAETPLEAIDQWATQKTT